MSLVSIKHENGLRVSVGIRQHKLILDVPADQGGTDTGPTPVELLASALGACMAMHIAKYCKAARLPHEGFGIDLDFQLAKDPLRIGSLTVDIALPPGFPRSALKPSSAPPSNARSRTRSRTAPPWTWKSGPARRKTSRPKQTRQQPCRESIGEVEECRMQKSKPLLLKPARRGHFPSRKICYSAAFGCRFFFCR